MSTARSLSFYAEYSKSKRVQIMDIKDKIEEAKNECEETET